MAKTRSPVRRATEPDPAQLVLDELRGRAEAMDPEFLFTSGRMDYLRLGPETVVHALARAGAADDARQLIGRVKPSSRRGPLHALAVALAERDEPAAAREAARELPAKGKPYSARDTLVELVEIQARRGDFDGAVQAAEALDNIEDVTELLINVAQLWAEREVGNFAHARLIPQVRTSSAWVVTADLFARAGERARGLSAAARTLHRALERAQTIPANAERSLQLEVVAHRLAWYGDTAGALEAARSMQGTVARDEALARVAQALAERGDLPAAERLAAELKSKGPRGTAESWLAHARAGESLGREPVEVWAWDAALAQAEDSDDPDDRLTLLVRHVELYLLNADGGRAFLAALLRVRQALAEGGKAIKAAKLRKDLVTTDVFGCEVKGRGRKAGGVQNVALQRWARLCRIAGAQAILGDLPAALETVGLIEDEDFRACALGLALRGWIEGRDRVRFTSS